VFSTEKIVTEDTGGAHKGEELCLTTAIFSARIAHEHRQTPETFFPEACSWLCTKRKQDFWNIARSLLDHAALGGGVAYSDVRVSRKPADLGIL
jgi:hypothetical protein